MEEEAERMAALKKAYAEIILSTAKESAARVLAADRRAMGSQQSMFTAKEEALATMLRLKAIMEVKIREAEKTALRRAKKIEELELQLGEAEDTIVDLREELKRLREELRMMKNGSVPLNEQVVNDLTYNNTHKEASLDTLDDTHKEASLDTLDESGNMQTISNPMTILSQKTAGTHPCCLKNVEKAEYPKEFSADVDCSVNAALTSIVWNRKEPELYRNGYTQRIRALEHNILTSKGPFRESNGFGSSSKNEPLTCTNEKLEITCKVDSAKSVKHEETKQRPSCYEAEETGQGSGNSANGNVMSHSVGSPRRQRATSNHSNSFSDAIYSDKAKSYDNSLKFTIHDKHYATEAPKEDSAFILVSSEIHETAEDTTYKGAAEMENLIPNKCSLDTSIKKESFGFKQCSKSKTGQSVNNQSQSDRVNDVLKNYLKNIEDDRKWITVQDLLPWSTSSKNNGHPSGGFLKDLRNTVEVATSRSKTENVIENSEKSVRVETEMGAPLLHPNSNYDEIGTDQTGEDKFLKYTFQRKRKRGCCPSKNENSFPEKRQTLSTKSADKQIYVPEPSEPRVATDLPRNNRRLVQVARQLISLSEKRW